MTQAVCNKTEEAEGSRHRIPNMGDVLAGAPHPVEKETAVLLYSEKVNE